MAGGIAALSVPVSTASAASELPDPEGVTEKESVALTFAESYLKITDEEKAAETWGQLSEQQATAVNEAIRGNIEIRHDRITNDTAGSDVGTNAIVASYTDRTQHLVESAVIYELEHTIEWSFDLQSDSVTTIHSRDSSMRSPPPFWEERGIVSSDLQNGPSYFDSYVEGQVDHEQPYGGTYYPELELRGQGDGTGSTILADNGF